MAAGRGFLRVAGQGDDEEGWRAGLKLNDHGEPRGTLDNALAILRNGYRGRLSYDLMALQPYLDGAVLSDAGVTRLRGEVGTAPAFGGYGCSVPVGDFRAALLAVAESYVQLLTPTSDSSPVARYLEKKGPGIHHVGYRVADCAAALQSVKDHGGQVIDQAPRPGSRGTTVAFVHPKGAFGTLIELVQE